MSSSGPRPVVVVGATRASCASWGTWSCPLSRKMCSGIIAWATRCELLSSAPTPLTLNFPHLPANSRALHPEESRAAEGICVIRGACASPRLQKLPQLQELKFLRPAEVSLQTHYKSKWVFKWPWCCSFSPSAMLILVNISYFFLVSSVSSASWQGLHVIHDKKFRMTWKSFENG